MKEIEDFHIWQKMKNMTTVIIMMYTLFIRIFFIRTKGGQMPRTKEYSKNIPETEELRRILG